MNKKLKILLLIVLAAIVVVVIYDYLSTFPGRRSVPSFKYDLKESKIVDENLITYSEVKRIALNHDNIYGFSYKNGKIWLIADNMLRIISVNGQELLRVELDNTPHCIAGTNDHNIIIGFNNYLALYDLNGEELLRSDIISESSDFTSVAISNDHIFVADAGRKKVLVFDADLQKTDSFTGESIVSDHHGFILPSGYFNLAVNKENELWVTNPGVLAIQHYAANGRLRRYWGEPSFGLNGFSGCCNPYFISFMSDGSFVTSEKGLVRVKIHKPSGEFSSVVAAPKSFPGGKIAPAVAVDENDNIWILDFDKKSIRLFEKIMNQ